MTRQACLAMILGAVLPCFGTVIRAEEKSPIVADAPNDKIRDEFQDLICAAAIDIRSPIHHRALASVHRHQYTDPRFDAFFRDAVLIQDPDPAKTMLRRTAAVSLFEFVQIDKAEKITLLFDLLGDEEIGFLDSLRSNPSIHSLDDYKGMFSPVYTIVEVLKRHKELLPALLEEKLKAEDPKMIYCALAAYSAPSKELKGFLLRAAKSDNNEAANFAFITLDEVLAREQIDAKREASAMKLNVDVDPRFAAYVKKVFSRYDSNQNERLDANEWNKMLLDPSRADSDANGEITVSEYAEFMRQRSASVNGTIASP